MNEIASDDELESENVDAATTAEALLRANISQKVIILTSVLTLLIVMHLGWSDNSADGGQEGEADKAEGEGGGGHRGARGGGGGEASHQGRGFPEAGQYFPSHLPFAGDGAFSDDNIKTWDNLQD